LPQIFRQAGGHQPKGVPQTVNFEEETVPGIEHPGSTGVIYCSDRAMANGFSYASSHEWANLGQGAPEVGPIPDAPNRPTSIDMPTDSLEYAPTTGVKGNLIFLFVWLNLMLQRARRGLMQLMTRARSLRHIVLVC
jgi:hypothetical protein